MVTTTLGYRKESGAFVRSTPSYPHQLSIILTSPQSSDSSMAARRQKRELRSRPWASNSGVGSVSARAPQAPHGGQETVGTGKVAKRFAPQSFLPVFNGDISTKSVVAHTMADSFASVNCRLPRLATRSFPVVEKKQKRFCAISKSSGAAGVMDSSAPSTKPEKDEVEAQRAVSNSSVDSDG